MIRVDYLRVVDDLAIAFQDHDYRLHPPGLLAQLDRADRSSNRPDDGSAPVGRPRSRPPGRLDFADHARQAKTFIVDLDLHLRRHYSVTWARDPVEALLALPVLLPEPDRETLHTLRHHRSVAMTALGWQEPIRTLPSTSCFDCGSLGLRVQPGVLSAWCDACGSDYDQTRLALLLVA